MYGGCKIVKLRSYNIMICSFINLCLFHLNCLIIVCNEPRGCGNHCSERQRVIPKGCGNHCTERQRVIPRGCGNHCTERQRVIPRGCGNHCTERQRVIPRGCGNHCTETQRVIPREKDVRLCCIYLS